jgi:dTDP-4-dehydrorhamnose reductase
MKILGTGLTGLVGSRIVELLKNKYEFENISGSAGTDITDRQDVQSLFEKSSAQVVLHLAAKTNVDDCEKDKSLGQTGSAWKINVDGTKNIADSCLRTNKKLIYVSTDFVFDGENPPAGGYSEDDSVNPINWYAQTKYEGEKIVQSLKTPWIITRVAYPYRAQSKSTKSDFFRIVLNRLKKDEPILAVDDHIFTPTFIDDIAFAIDALIGNSSQGIFHVVGSQSLTPFAAANLIADKFKLDKSKTHATTRSEFFKNRAVRPFQLALNNDKITKLGVRMKTFKEGLDEILKQVQNDNKKI